MYRGRILDLALQLRALDRDLDEEFPFKRGEGIVPAYERDEITLWERVFVAMSAAPERPFTPTQMAYVVGKASGPVNTVLHQRHSSGHVGKPARGLYRLLRDTC